jgi:hypothetical protein
MQANKKLEQDQLTLEANNRRLEQDKLVLEAKLNALE